MTVTLNLKPEVESDLLARARASGMPLEQYLLCLVESAARPTARNTAAPGQPARVEAVRRMVEFGRNITSASASRLPASCCMKDTASDGGLRLRRLRCNFMVFPRRSNRGYPL